MQCDFGAEVAVQKYLLNEIDGQAKLGYGSANLPADNRGTDFFASTCGDLSKANVQFLMRITLFALAASVTLPVLLSTAHAATFDPMKSLTSATKWDELTKEVEARFPKLIADEFKAATKDLPFPTVRSYKGSLVVTDSSGARITLAFKKDGVALLNGKPMVIQPLGTVEAEVKRLAAGGVKTSSLFQYLLPEAHAGAALGLGLAAFAFAGADNHKAEACAAIELSEDLTQSCPLMGVGMVIKASAKDSLNKSTKPLKTVGLKCPATNAGILDLLRKNNDGIYARLRFKVVDGKITKSIAEFSEKGGAFEVYNVFDVQNPSKSADMAEGYSAIKEATPLLEKVCNNPEGLARFNTLIESNKKSLAQYDGSTPAAQPSAMDVH